MAGNRRWFFLRDNTNFPVACVASELDEYPNGQHVRFSLSIRNPIDVYDHVIGRNVALGRLTAGKDVKVVDRTGAKTSILHLLAANIHLPERVRKAARFRLAVKAELNKFDKREETT